MLLILNNRDSFVFNLDRYFKELGEETQVLNAHTSTLAQIDNLAPSAIVISPGPCTPKEAGISRSVVQEYSGKRPILGVCLGHQVIGDVFGGQIKRAKNPLYGRAAQIEHDGAHLFSGLPQPLTVGLYHSLIVDIDNHPDLVVQARSPAGEVMALRHCNHPTFGIQFHPESILSESGHDLLRNFLSIVRQPA